MPGEQRHQLQLRRRAAIAEAVASPPSRMSPRLPSLAVDQPAVEIADLDAEPPLAEIVIDRIGRLEIGELQDALIDRRHREHRRRPPEEIGDADRDARPLWRGSTCSGTVIASPASCARLRIDGEPGRADGAAGPVLIGLPLGPGRKALTST